MNKHLAGLCHVALWAFLFLSPLTFWREWTASSGEATLLAFRGLKNARTFGSPTAGYASANIPFQLSDGYTMVITTSQDVARTDEVFCDDPIVPDVVTETPLEDAVNWIIMNY